jgi:hypothetical protein
MAREPTLAEVLRTAIENRLLDVHTAIPGKVVTYDAARQTADVQPMVRHAFRRSDGSTAFEDLPVCPSVPVAWPSGGGFYLHLPLAAGDTVMLVFSQSATGAYRETGQLSPPGDLRRHSPGYPIAIPMRLAVPQVMADAPASGQAVAIVAPGGHLRVSATGGAASSEFVALSEKVTAQLQALKDAITGAVPLAQDGGAQLKTQILSALAAWPGDVASTTLKAQ